MVTEASRPEGRTVAGGLGVTAELVGEVTTGPPLAMRKDVRGRWETESSDGKRSVD